MHAVGRKPTARVISKEIVTANTTVASHLALTKGERVVRIRRVRVADGVPISFDETYLLGDRQKDYDPQLEGRAYLFAP